jgi:hypothetical protein
MTVHRSLAPGVSRVGQPTHELRLHQAVIENAVSFIPRPFGAVEAFHEFVLRGARPDVLVADVDHDVVAERRRAGIEPFYSRAAAAVVACLRARRGVAPYEELIDVAAAAVGTRAARSAVRDLQRDDLLTRSTRPALAPCLVHLAVRRVVGIEAKMGRWRSAAGQALRWRLLVDQAWLAFPESYLHSLPELPGLDLFGIAGIDLAGRIVVDGRPPSRRADRQCAALTEQYVYARVLSDAQASVHADAAHRGVPTYAFG